MTRACARMILSWQQLSGGNNSLSGTYYIKQRNRRQDKDIGAMSMLTISILHFQISYRNLFTSSGNPAQIAILVDYVRKELHNLDTMSSDDFLESRNLFGTQAPALRGVPGK